MSKPKKTPAERSKDSRDRKKAEKLSLGIETISIDMAVGVKAGMAEAMKRNGIKNAPEAWQNIGLYLMQATPDEQDRMLKCVTSPFEPSEKVMRDFNEKSRAIFASQSDGEDELTSPE